MNFAFTILAALSTPALAADIDVAPIPEPVPIEITVSEPEEENTDACNCYNLLIEQFESVPTMHQLEQMASSKVGNVAFMRYPATSEWPAGLPHVAMVRDTLPDGSLLIEEYNYDRCQHTYRTIASDYERLVGYVSL